MANEYGFFAAKDHDRRYSADDFCALFNDFFTDGVLGTDTNYLAVSAGDEMNVSIGEGTAYIQGRWYRRSSAQTLSLSDSDTVYDRYDAVVIRCDYNQRMVYAAINEGVPAEIPEKPSIQRDEEAYEIVLAYVYVGANSISVSQEDIEDVRGNSELCGWVTGAVDQIDTTGLFAQYDAEWELLRAGCAKDADEVIAAWSELNTTKSVNEIYPEGGNVTLLQGDVPHGGGAYQMPYYTQLGSGATDSSTGLASISFETSYKSVPMVFLSAKVPAHSSYVFCLEVQSLSESGFTAFGSRPGATGTTCVKEEIEFDWIAFGEISLSDENAADDSGETVEEV